MTDGSRQNVPNDDRTFGESDEYTTTSERSELMSRVRTSDTEPEMKVRRLVHGIGYRYRVDVRDLPGSPDLANKTRRWAIFVHGCFWHHHEGCDKATIPDRNDDFWKEKFRKNKKRDREARTALEDEGFEVLIVWECEIQRELPTVALRIEEVLKKKYSND